MIGKLLLAAAAATTTFASPVRSEASDGPMIVAFFNQEHRSGGADLTGSTSRDPSAGAKGPGRGGSITKQTDRVSTACLKPELLRLIREASSRFGAAAVITSGYRPGRHSYHGRCMAADVQIPGVAPGALARWFRAQPGVGGVGTYGHTRSVHVDVAPRQYSWHHGRRKRLATTRLARA